MKASRYLLVSPIVLLLAAGGYTAYWFATARSLEAGLNKWADQRRAQGYDLTWRDERVGGFPFAFRIALTDASIARGNSYRVAVPEIVGSASPLDLSRWRIEAAQGGAGRAQGFEADIAAQSLSGAVTLGGDASTLDVSAREVSGAGAEAGEIAGHFTLPRHAPASHRDLGLAASVQLYHLTLPKPVKALGDTIETFAVDVDVMGGLPKGDWRQALTAWRDDGGTVELRQGKVQWGALRLEAKGTVALDGDMQPTAALRASIVDQGALVDAAVEAGMLKPKNAPLVKLVLDFLAKDGPDGRKRLSAPVTLQDRKLAVGRAEIGKVPPIEWK